MQFDDKSQAQQQGDVPEGEKGSGFINGVFADNPFKPEEVQAFNSQAHELKASAQEGGWAIDEEGLRAYLKVCDTFLDKYPEMIEQAQTLMQRAKLGSSPYAYAVADFNVKVANSDEKSLIPNLQLMKDGYVQLREALHIARENYNENEAAMVQHLGKLMPSDDAQ